MSLNVGLRPPPRVIADPDCAEFGCTHPHRSIGEWVQMWMAGLESAEIAALCGVGRWDVQQVIDRRVRRDPTLPVRRLKRHLHPAPATHAQRYGFDQKLAEYRWWLATTGHQPREHGHTDLERTIAGWIRRQRAADRDGTLTADRRAALDQLGRWQRPALGAPKDGHFAERVDQLAAFVAEHHRLPTRYGDPGVERVLAVWLMGVRGVARAGTLTEQRRTALDTAAPDWLPRVPTGP
ncbi:helicase associated domain-containing protein [Tersicoccus sp. MR15.9]|uniref:helicase associated domain-containing protein n=1 Tax=Tersicoccus mangrovi TaxID=3121635 RepID=UPI002FE5D7D7